jgi:uncharacterized protein
VQTLLELAWAGFALPKSYTCHGIGHPERVVGNAVAIALAKPGGDVLTCRFFAVLHDSKRHNEGFDPGHGHRAADRVKALHEQVPLSDEDFERLLYACRFPNIRVGIPPQARYFSTRAGRDLLGRI